MSHLMWKFPSVPYSFFDSIGSVQEISRPNQGHISRAQHKPRERTNEYRGNIFIPQCLPLSLSDCLGACAVCRRDGREHRRIYPPSLQLASAHLGEIVCRRGPMAASATASGPQASSSRSERRRGTRVNRRTAKRVLCDCEGYYSPRVW